MRKQKGGNKEKKLARKNKLQKRKTKKPKSQRAKEKKLNKEARSIKAIVGLKMS